MIKFAGSTDCGLVRENNEDSWTADPDLQLFVVSDGMGGHAGGEVASKIVVDALPAALAELRDCSDSLSDPSALQRVADGVIEVNDLVRERSFENPRLSGMGATVVLAIIRGDELLVAHVGDSRAYLCREGELHLLTKDHTVAQFLVEIGEVTQADAVYHPGSHQLTRYLGMPEPSGPEITVSPVEPNDRLMLCSDGLGYIPDEAIRSVLAETADLEDSCERLIEAANATGGKDNSTVLLVDIDRTEAE